MGTIIPKAQIEPEGDLDVLSQMEVKKLLDTSHGKGLYNIFRRCSLAVLNSGRPTIDGIELFEQHKNFDINVIPQEKGMYIELINAPSIAFVDGEMIKGIKELLFAILRDIIYMHNEIYQSARFDLSTSEGITNSIFHVLRNAQIFKPHIRENLVVCWGGHSIDATEYDYSKEVGYELGIRGFNICTGCGWGAMKGPMKGAAIAHAKQRIYTGTYIGVTEPGIITSEPPNPIVNELIVMPDIEKRLETFIRLGHGIIIFPGGVGTTEEILYLLGILLNPQNQRIPLPIIITAPKKSKFFLNQLNHFIETTLGFEAQQIYKIIFDDPQLVAKEMKSGINKVLRYRKEKGDAYYFNWLLKIENSFQIPFEPTHENMSKLNLCRNQPVHELAANLRCAFSAIVSGNVKEKGIQAIEKFGPYQIHGDPEIIQPLDELLSLFVEQKRMKVSDNKYEACYQLI